MSPGPPRVLPCARGQHGRATASEDASGESLANLPELTGEINVVTKEVVFVVFDQLFLRFILISKNIYT